MPEKMTPEERWKAVQIVMDEAPHAFPTIAGASRWVRDIEHEAHRLHRLYEHACNRGLSPAEQRTQLGLETRLRTWFAERGLRLYLQSDPRGNLVGILTPRTQRFNTLGGVECGWRL